MNATDSTLIHGTSGSPQLVDSNYDMERIAQEKKEKLNNGQPKIAVPSAFDKKGHVSADRLTRYPSTFMNKTIYDIANEMSKYGYEYEIILSSHKSSKAMKIVVKNNSIDLNIQQVLVSPGSSRHGNVPYVKISTTDEGKFKIIDSKLCDYKTDGNEKAFLIFGRDDTK